MKYIVFGALIIFSGQSFALEEEFSEETIAYIEGLEWEKRWTNVISEASDRYIERVEQIELSHLDSDQKEALSLMFSQELSNRIGWESFAKTVSDGLIEVCGNEVLDAMLSLNTELELTRETRDKTKSQYSDCARESLGNSMRLVLQEVAVFSLEKAKIIRQSKEQSLNPQSS